MRREEENEKRERAKSIVRIRSWCIYSTHLLDHSGSYGSSVILTFRSWTSGWVWIEMTWYGWRDRERKEALILRERRKQAEDGERKKDRSWYSYEVGQVGLFQRRENFN